MDFHYYCYYFDPSSTKPNLSCLCGSNVGFDVFYKKWYDCELFDILKNLMIQKYMLFISHYFGILPRATLISLAYISYVFYSKDNESIDNESMRNTPPIEYFAYKISVPPDMTSDEFDVFKKIANILLEYKNKLPEQDAQKIARLGLFAKNSSEDLSVPMCVVNIDKKNILTDRHKIIVSSFLLNLFNNNQITHAELRAFLAHEVSHIVLNHAGPEGILVLLLHELLQYLIIMIIISTEELALNALLFNHIDSTELSILIVFAMIVVALNRQNTSISQNIEYQADKHSIILSGSKKDLITGLEKMSSACEEQILPFIPLTVKRAILFPINDLILGRTHPTNTERAHALNKI